MSTLTSRLKMIKQAGSDFWSINTLNGNLDIVDGAVGVTLCTSTTRPSTPFTGQQIFETDTTLSYIWSGSVWSRIVNPIAYTSAASVPAPFVNQIIFDLSDSIWKRCTATSPVTWFDMMPGNTNFNHHEVDFSASGTLGSNARTPIGWTATGGISSPDVTLSNNGVITGGAVTFVRGGVWDVGIAFDCDETPGVTAFALRAPTDTGPIFLGSGSNPMVTDSAPFRIAAGTIYSVIAVQQTGVNQTYTGRFRAAWLRG